MPDFETIRSGRETPIGAGLLARNTLLNLTGQFFVGIIAILAVPAIIRGLGAERFGILSLVWIVLGYLSFVDLGLGRATTKYVAEYLGKGETQLLSRLVWTSLLFQVALGTLGAILLAVFAPFLVNGILRIPRELVGETMNSFLISAAALPILVATATLRGVLEAGQRFDFVNLVKAPLNACTYLIPIGGLAFGLHLPEIVLLLVVARLAGGAAYLLFVVRVFRNFLQRPQLDLRLMRSLITYGGWVTVSSVAVPVLVYSDRLLIGSLLSVAAVAYYAGPYEMLNGFWILPASLTLSLFPAFSALGGASAGDVWEDIYSRSVKYVMLTLGPLMVLVVGFAETILRVWLGGDFPDKSARVLQILAVGVLIGALGWIPAALLQGLGRPDVTAKCHLLQLPLYGVMAWVLIHEMGIGGAAIAFTLRVSIEAAFLFAACWRLGLVSHRALVRGGVLHGVLALAGFAGCFSAVSFQKFGLVDRSALGAAVLFLFAAAAWRYVLDGAERSFVTSLVRQAVGHFGRGT